MVVIDAFQLEQGKEKDSKNKQVETSWVRLKAGRMEKEEKEIEN